MKKQEAQQVLKKVGCEEARLWLQRRREFSQLNRLQLANLSGVPQSNIHRIENGKQRLTPRTLARLITAIEKHSPEKAHSLSLKEMANEITARYVGLKEPPLGPKDIPELVELIQRLAQEAGEARRQLNFFNEWHRQNPPDQRAERAEAQKENIEKFVEQHLPEIATGEAAKLAEKDKELALSKEAHKADLREQQLA